MTPPLHDRAFGAIVTEIVAAIRDDPAGPSYIEGYAQIAVDLAELDPLEHEEDFLDLADLARRHRDAGNDDLFRPLAELARIGLVPLARRQRHGQSYLAATSVPENGQT